MTDRTIRIDDLDLTIDDRGEGRPVLVLHGGGGPGTVSGLAQHLALGARTLTPTLPGWNGTPRPEGVRRVEDIAARLSTWIAAEDLRDLAVVGSSIGGWIAAELAVRDREEGRITALALIDSVGFDVPGHPIRDFFALDARGVAEYSFFDSERFYVDPATVPDERAAVVVANLATMKAVAGDPYMADPGLLAAVGAVRIPALAIWGDSDRIVTPDYGRVVAEAFGDCRLQIVQNAGHLPQLERPEATYDLLDAYLSPTA